MALRRAVLLLLVALGAAALVLASSGEDEAEFPALGIPALEGGGTTVVVDSFGRPLRRIADAQRAGEARRWLRRARPLGEGAPRWARRMHARSLLVLRALTRSNGAVIAGARNRWAYVWPRDAGAAALAYAAAGYDAEARRVAGFLRRLDLEAAARFRPDGTPVPGRAAQGDAAGWVAVAARAAGLDLHPVELPWRNRADYHEGAPGDYLANALAACSAVPYPCHLGIRNSGSELGGFLSRGALVRVAGDPDSGWDSAAAWGVRPFAQPSLFPAIRRTLRRIAASSGRFGIITSQNWHGGDDPWTAPTAWTAWGLAALARHAAPTSHTPGSAARGPLAIARADRRAALRLMGALRRSATPLGLLPERVDADTGQPTSTTPLTWSHAFAILALHELWP